MGTSHLGRVVLVTLAIATWPGWAKATSIDKTPRPALLLKRSAQFITVNAWNSAALYDLNDGSQVGEFKAATYIHKLDVTPDEAFLLAGCGDGWAYVWEIASGRQVVAVQTVPKDRQFIYDASFAADGKSFVVCNYGGQVLVYETETGVLAREFRSPDGEMVLSAALSPNGSQGVALDLGENVYLFDVAAGTLEQTGIRGAWPARYSLAGGHVGLQSNNSGSAELFRVVKMRRKPVVTDLGPFGYIDHIRPTEDGFLITCREHTRGTDHYFTVGRRIAADKPEATEVWRLKNGGGQGMDFDPKSMKGVCTTWFLETQVYDLATGALLYKIDKHEGYQEPTVSQKFLGMPTWMPILGVPVILLAIWWRVRRRGRQESLP